VSMAFATRSFASDASLQYNVVTKQKFMPLPEHICACVSHLWLSWMHHVGWMGVALGRNGLPHDMAGPALFLCSRAGAYVNGAVLPVDGGMHI
jgi:NAD(P)-dependent dehydrogenase (short-subunit alcohol dehydrogenase family)